MVQAMTKSELIEELVSSKTTDLKDAADRDIAEGVSLIIAEMSKALIEGNRIEIRGFGSFGLKYRYSLFFIMVYAVILCRRREVAP